MQNNGQKRLGAELEHTVIHRQLTITVRTFVQLWASQPAEFSDNSFNCQAFASHTPQFIVSGSGKRTKSLGWVKCRPYQIEK